MNTFGPSTLFLFSDKEYPIMLDKEVKDEIVNMYEKRIHEFLNTWMIFSCSNANCCKYKPKENIYLMTGKDNVISNAFEQIFGKKYFNNIFQYIIPRLVRFRHILKCENNPSFDLSFKDYVENNTIILPKVLSKNDEFTILNTYKRIFIYYSKIINGSTKNLLDQFDSIVKENTNHYLEINSFKPGVFPFIEENTFYNNAYLDIKEKALVSFFELICRFFDIIDINVYSNITPTSQYVDGFFKIQKAIVSNDILYIFLHDSKNVLVYDFENKLALENIDPNENVKYTVIDNTRHIYSISFSSKIKNMVYTQDNLILFLANGVKLINGSNENHKITIDDSPYYAHFIDFNYCSSLSINFIKIYKKHIYLMDSKSIIRIYGDPQNNNPLFENAMHISDNIYKNTNYKNNSDFSLSENEENIILLSDENIGKKFAFNDFDIEVVDDKIITLTKHDENHTVLTFDVSSSNIANSTLSNIFRLTNDALILEYKDNNSNSYYYYILGNTNTDNRLGYSSDNFENKDDELSELHDITEFIQVNKNGEIDNSVRIKEIETFENRTLILMDNGLLFGSGKNDGYFVAVANNSSNELENTEILNEFTILNPSSISSKIDGITTTKNTDKSLVFLYNELYGYGFGSYFFLGMRNGSSFRNTDAEVIERFEDQSINHKTGPDFYSYFCTKNCIYFINPIFDLIAHFYLSSESFENDSIAHVISSLLFLRDMSITYNEEAYNHIVNNLTILSDEDNPVFANMNHHIYNNIQNYLMHDAMLLMYSNDEEKYNAVSKFINLIGLMGENFSAMKTKKCKINDVPFDEFVRSINDINRKSNFNSEDNRNGIRFNPFRAR